VAASDWSQKSALPTLKERDAYAATYVGVVQTVSLSPDDPTIHKQKSSRRHCRGRPKLSAAGSPSVVHTVVYAIVPMQTLTLTEAAAFLKMHPEEVRSRAKRGVLPACKPRRRWVFIDDDLAAFLRERYAPRRQALRVASEKGRTTWPYASEAPSGGSTSWLHQASAYEEALRPAIRPRRRPPRLWNDAVVRWLKETAHKATHDTTKRSCVVSIRT
jgi:hypothetical protein